MIFFFVRRVLPTPNIEGKSAMPPNPHSPKHSLPSPVSTVLPTSVHSVLPQLQGVTYLLADRKVALKESYTVRPIPEGKSAVPLLRPPPPPPPSLLSRFSSRIRLCQSRSDEKNQISQSLHEALYRWAVCFTLHTHERLDFNTRVSRSTLCS